MRHSLSPLFSLSFSCKLYLKELAEYDQSTSTDRPIFLNDNEDYPVQNKESPKNSSEETVVSKTNQEPPQDSDIHQLIEECSIKVPEQQKQKIKDTMFELEEIRLIENLLYDNSFPRPPEEFNTEIANTIIESIPLLPIPVQDGNSQQEEINIVTETDDVLPPSIEDFADDPEGDIRFLEELLIDDSILSDELSDANFKENPSISRPPPKPPDVKTNAGEEIPVVMINKDKFDDDYQIFMFDKDCPPKIEVILCRIYLRFLRSSYPLIDFSLGRSISF
nr:hypothetical protein [Tanacetum cinerariifolium]